MCIAMFASLMGNAKIALADFSGLSSRVSVCSCNDDYSGKYLTNPTIPSKFTGVENSQVYIGLHAIVGGGSIVLPISILNEGVSVGALSLVVGGLKEWPGNPAINERKIDLLEFEFKCKEQCQSA